MAGAARVRAHGIAKCNADANSDGEILRGNTSIRSRGDQPQRHRIQVHPLTKERKQSAGHLERDQLPQRSVSGWLLTRSARQYSGGHRTGGVVLR